MKMPSLVRRMSVQAVREESLQVRGPKNKFEKRILEELPIAAFRVEELYGARLRSIPSILSSNRPVHPDSHTLSTFFKELQRAGFISEQKRIKAEENARPEKPRGTLQRISHAIRAFTEQYYGIRTLFKFTMCYSAPLDMIQAPTREMFRAPSLRIRAVLAHELIHHILWEMRSPICSSDPLRSNLDDRELALNCANEGLAMYCETWPRIAPETGFLARVKELPFRLRYVAEKAFVNTFVYPQRLLADIAHSLMFYGSHMLYATVKLCRRNFWNTPEKFAEAVKNNFLARMAVHEYWDGLRFVEAVSLALGGPKEAFKAITEKPPETMQEVLLPEKYLSRIKSA
jgi:hypothetical protein